MANKPEKHKTRTPPIIEKYLSEINTFSLLSRKAEIELGRRIRAGDAQALHQLIEANLKFVVHIAKEYQGHGLPLQDLIGEGNLGLITAARRFDERRGVRFISYAVWWIRQGMQQALANHTRVVRLPLNRINAALKVRNTLSDLEKQLRREPSIDEIADEANMTPTDVVQALKGSAYQLSLDQPLTRDEEICVHDVFASNQYVPPDDSLMQESLQIDVNELLSTLEPRSAEVISRYFGLNGYKPQTLEMIGEYLGLTRERVRQIKEKTLKKLRRRAIAESLQKYLN
jgi:RNA polymerase primary sigma factor